MNGCRHVWVCKDTTPTGTPARCKLCGYYTVIPPVRWSKGQTKTISRLGVSAKRRFEYDLDLFHAEALAAEAKRGWRE